MITITQPTDDGMIHWRNATRSCPGGRSDSGTWSEVTCPDCLRHHAIEQALAGYEFLLARWRGEDFGITQAICEQGIAYLAPLLAPRSIEGLTPPR